MTGRVIPGMGVATSLPDLLAGFRRLASALPAVIDQYPGARVVRNQVGNLSIIGTSGIEPEYLGYIDVRTGDIVISE
jgi:hypothetical protein